MIAIVDDLEHVGELMGIQHPADKVDVHRIIVHENNGQRQGGRSLHEWHFSVEAVRASHTRPGSVRCRRTPCTTAPRGARVAVLSEVSHHDTSDVSCPCVLSLLQVQMVCQPRKGRQTRVEWRRERRGADASPRGPAPLWDEGVSFGGETVTTGMPDTELSR